MGAVETVSYDRFPEQGRDLGRVVEVAFNYDLQRTLPGRVVRDDREPPFQTIIALNDGRFIRAEECHYHVKERP